jgi:hypothetical protein
MGRRKNSLRVIAKYRMIPVDRVARAGMHQDASRTQHKHSTSSVEVLVSSDGPIYSEDDRLERATPTTRALYYKFKEAILNIANDISFRPTKKHIGLWAGDRRIANITINIQSFKIWIKVPPRTLKNDLGETTITKKAHTININNIGQRSRVLDWIKQAYER